MHTSNQPTIGVRNSIPSFDIIKFVCCFLILFIHASPLVDIAPTLHFYISDVLSRSSVCVFFGISGYLAFCKMETCNGKILNHTQNRSKLFRQWKRIALVYVTWVLVYILFMLPQWYRMNWWGMSLVKDLCISFIFSGVHYHLWFLLSMLYALPFLFLFCSYFKPRFLFATAGLAWLLHCLSQSYGFLGVLDIPIFLWFEEHFPVIWIAITRAYPLLAVGVLCARQKESHTSIYLPLISFAIYLGEASLLHFVYQSNSYTYLLSTPLFAYSMLHFLLTRQWNVPISVSKLCRNISLSIYCMHPLIIETYDLCSLPKGMLRFIIPAIITASLSVLWYFLSPVIKQRFTTGEIT